MSAGFDNFSAAARERERRQGMRLNSPGDTSLAQADYLGPGWDAFYGSLHDQSEAAAAQGKNFRVDFSGMADSMPQKLSLQQPSSWDADSARSIALNGYLDKDTQQFRLGQSAVKEAQARAQLATDTAFGAENDRQALDYAFQPGTGRDPMAALPGRLQPALQEQQRAAGLAERGMALNEGKQKEIERANRADESLAGSSVMSPAAVEDNARLYLQTGQMPTLGMKDPGNRQRILNRAAELSGGQGNLAGNRADYKADAGSLAKLQTSRDAIGAFESTAGKNIDIFLNAAGKVVDTGSPMANTVARLVSGKMLGSPDQAAFDAARQVAINEIAKITSNPNLSGTLSDSARHEVEAFNPREATLAQTVAVMRLLKQDMGNRIGSLDTALADIRGRIAAPGAKAGAAAPAGAGANAPRQIGKYSVVIH
jgi:hypothetical protein